MSERKGGAASAAPLATVSADGATPAHADQWEAEALAGIEQVQDPTEAERLLAKVTACGDVVRLAKLGEDRERRWRVVRLRAERRYGELLGPATTGGQRKGHVTGSNVGGAERAVQNKARKVAAIPQKAFDKYVKSDPKPSREGLLRKAPDHKDRPRPAQRNDSGQQLWQDEVVLTWVARRLKAKRTRDQMMAEANAGEHGWPLPGRKLPQNAADRAIAIVRDRQHRGDTPRRRPPSESGKRLRQLHADKRAGRRDPQSELWRMQVAIAEAIGVLERTELPDVEWSEDVDHILNEVVYDLERHRAWSDRQFDSVWAHIDDVGRQRKLRELRKRANDPSSTQSERESAANLAEKLERKYREQKALEPEAT